MAWKRNCLLINVNTNDNTLFQITKTELQVPVVTLKTDANTSLNKLFTEGFERSVFWNEYKSRIETDNSDVNNLKRIVLDSSFQEVNRLVVLSYLNDNSNKAINMNDRREYALPRVKLTKFNVLIDGRNFYDQPVSYDIRT